MSKPAKSQNSQRKVERAQLDTNNLRQSKTPQIKIRDLKNKKNIPYQFTDHNNS